MLNLMFLLLDKYNFKTSMNNYCVVVDENNYANNVKFNDGENFSNSTNGKINKFLVIKTPHVFRYIINKKYFYHATIQENYNQTTYCDEYSLYVNNVALLNKMDMNFVSTIDYLISIGALLYEYFEHIFFWTCVNNNKELTSSLLRKACKLSLLDYDKFNISDSIQTGFIYASEKANNDIICILQTVVYYQTIIDAYKRAYKNKNSSTLDILKSILFYQTKINKQNFIYYYTNK